MKRVFTINYDVDLHGHLQNNYTSKVSWVQLEQSVLESSTSTLAWNVEKKAW
jgi:hypothetical protein